MIGRMAVVVTGLVLASVTALPALAVKGDRQVTIRSAPSILSGKVLDLRFADFAQGIWTRQAADCAALTRIDTGSEGAIVAIYRGLLETPDQICNVYGAEQRPKGAQRAALNCVLDDGAETIGLVTLRQRGSQGLSLQDGERPPVYYRFCRAIVPVMSPIGQ